MAIKALLNRIDKYRVSHSNLGYDIYFCNIHIPDLLHGPIELWGFDHNNGNVYPQKNDVLLCPDGILKARSRYGNKRFLYHFRKIETIPAGKDGTAPPKLPELQGTYTDWLLDYGKWKAPLTLEVGESIQFPTFHPGVTLYPIGATNMQMVRLLGHIHFTCKGIPIPRPSQDAFFITPAGTLWQRASNREGFARINQPNLIFPTPPNSRKKR